MGESTFSSELPPQASLPIQGDENLLPFAQCGDQPVVELSILVRELEKYEDFSMILTQPAFCACWIVLQERFAFHENP